MSRFTLITWLWFGWVTWGFSTSFMGRFIEIFQKFILKINFEQLMLKTNRAYSRNLVQLRYWPERTLFYEKRHFLLKKVTFLKKSSALLPFPIPFLNILRQNKALRNFPKRGQHSIVKLNIGLEYTLNTIRKILSSLFNS